MIVYSYKYIIFIYLFEIIHFSFVTYAVIERHGFKKKVLALSSLHSAFLSRNSQQESLLMTFVCYYRLNIYCTCYDRQQYILHLLICLLHISTDYYWNFIFPFLSDISIFRLKTSDFIEKKTHSLFKLSRSNDVFYHPSTEVSEIAS